MNNYTFHICKYPILLILKKYNSLNYRVFIKNLLLQSEIIINFATSKFFGWITNVL